MFALQVRAFGASSRQFGGSQAGVEVEIVGEVGQEVLTFAARLADAAEVVAAKLREAAKEVFDALTEAVILTIL